MCVCVCARERKIERVFLSIFIGHFPQKSPIISGSFAKNDLQPKAKMERGIVCACAQDVVV